jgi:glucose/arabinose dehydrogenase
MNDGALAWRLAGLGTAIKVGRALFARFVQLNGVRVVLVTVAFVAGACGGDEPSGEQVSSFPTTTASPEPSQTRTPIPTPTPPPTPTPVADTGSLPALNVERAFQNLSFDRMVQLTHSGADDGMLYVVLQPGRVIVFEDDVDVEEATVFLDIRERVNDSGNEEGLLSIAFPPDFEERGHFYVYYSASSPRRSVVSRFFVGKDGPVAADPASEMIVLEVPQPFANHNGGQLAFGPDGYLYIGLGDGGNRADPQGNGQDTSTLLGSILRIDVSNVDAVTGYTIPPDNPFITGTGGARGEIWAFGLRNPWRFSFDRETGDLWAGDVGQNRYEEIDLIEKGLNYGWNVMEGLHCFSGSRVRSDDEACQGPGLALPVIEYGRTGGCSVTGGFVYRGERLPELTGAYVYGDFCTGHIWALRHDGSEVTEHRLLFNSDLQIPAFGESPSGELYVLSFSGGIYRLKVP